MRENTNDQRRLYNRSHARGIVDIVLLPLILIVLAIVAAAWMAYGTGAGLAHYSHGLHFIMLTRRLQWPLVSLSLLLCLVLLVLVISGRRRAWWLIGLGPVLALFAHRFMSGPSNQFSVADSPAMVSADQATLMHEGDWVVGLTLDDQSYAFPYAQLYSTPAVVLPAREKRVLVLFSPFANVATALLVDRDLHGRNIDIVSMPADALLIYDSRLGQFINGITGKTGDGSTPACVRGMIIPYKTTWQQWLAAHHDTLVMAPTGRAVAGAPTAPILPRFHVEQDDASARRLIALVPSTQPLAVPEDQIKTAPLNLMAGVLPVLIFRDPSTQQLRAFDRRIEVDLMPRFSLNTDRKRKGVLLVDADTSTGWSSAGVAIDGDKRMHGQKLRPIDVQEDLYWGVMKFWYPNLELVSPQ